MSTTHSMRAADGSFEVDWSQDDSEFLWYSWPRDYACPRAEAAFVGQAADQKDKAEIANSYGSNGQGFRFREPTHAAASVRLSAIQFTSSKIHFSDNIGRMSGMTLYDQALFSGDGIADPELYEVFGERRSKEQAQVEVSTPHRVAYRHDGQNNAVHFDTSVTRYAPEDLWAETSGRYADIPAAERIYIKHWQLFRQ